MSKFHTPVLLTEVIKFLNVEKGQRYIDATVGGGGHTEKILEKGGIVLGIDCDLDAIEFCAKKFGLELKKKEDCIFAQDSQLTLVWQNFSKLKEAANHFGFTKIAGIIFDLGVSFHQLEKSERGFSLEKNGPLDMRMDQRLNITAADLINHLSRRQLEEVFKKFGQEKHYRAIARTVDNFRLKKRIETTGELAHLIESVVPKRGRLHPATRIFMALRIIVNSELNNLRQALPQAADLLLAGGRLAVISFHSLEDGIVKQFFKERDDLCLVTIKPVIPSEQEIRENPHARSAKLRVAEKLN